uniref:Uncharacterized protein n=1 Tax=Candidatus Kentrum sp. DK TaxID=2126562 RepID=A0A450SQS3_9GAMM|nr:MAG: hypothetical protein BECKDK2373C_GA0170839_10536 [Candidatus Kentron sp. DK]
MVDARSLSTLRLLTGHPRFRPGFSGGYHAKGAGLPAHPLSEQDTGPVTRAR